MTRLQSACALAAAVLATTATYGDLFYTQPANVHSSLVGYSPAGNNNPGKVSDTQLATWLGDALNPGGVPKIKDANFLFQQCFSGGMIDDIIPKMGANIPFTGASAASWWQTALATAKPFNANQPLYATWSQALVPQLKNFPNQTMVQSELKALQGDRLGPNGYWKETPNYGSKNGGDTLTLRDAPVDAAGGTHYAVFFAGSVGVYGSANDAKRLGQSVRNVFSDLVDALNNAWAGKNYQIKVLYGDGTAATLGFDTASNNLNNKFNSGALHTSAGAATPAVLQQTIANLGNNANDSFFFFGFDHGDISRSFRPAPVKVNKGANRFDTFALDEGDPADPNNNPNGLLLALEQENDNGPDDDPPTLEFLYDGIDVPTFTGTLDVLLNGHPLGALDPTKTDLTFVVNNDFLLLQNTVEVVNNSNQDFNLNDAIFDLGPVPPLAEDFVPEPTGLAAVMAIGFVLRRRRSS